MQWFIGSAVQLLNLLIFYFTLSSHLFPLSWIEEIALQSSKISRQSSINSFKSIIGKHNSLNRGLGLYFLLLYSFCQISLIANLFNSITIMFYDNYEFTEKIVWTASFLLMSLHLMFFILSITCTVEHSYESVIGLKELLKEKFCKFQPKLSLTVDSPTLSFDSWSHGSTRHQNGHWTIWRSQAIVRKRILLHFKEQFDQHDKHQHHLSHHFVAIQNFIKEHFTYN